MIRHYGPTDLERICRVRIEVDPHLDLIHSMTVSPAGSDNQANFLSLGPTVVSCSGSIS